MRGCARGRIFICRRCALHSPHQLQSRFRSSVRRVAMMMSPRSSILPSSGIAIKPLSHAGGHSAIWKTNISLWISTRCRPRDAGGRQLHLLYPGIAWRRETELFAVLRSPIPLKGSDQQNFLPGLADGQPVTLRPAGDRWRGALSPGLSMGDRGARGADGGGSQ